MVFDLKTQKGGRRRPDPSRGENLISRAGRDQISKAGADSHPGLAVAHAFGVAFSCAPVKGDFDVLISSDDTEPETSLSQPHSMEDIGVAG